MTPRPMAARIWGWRATLKETLVDEVRPGARAPAINDMVEVLAGAVHCHQTGKLAEAEALYRQVLATQPQHVDALHLLGVLAHQVGRPRRAIEAIRKAIALQPNVPSFYNNLAVILQERGELDEAAELFETALRLAPNYGEACRNLGDLRRRQGQLDEACTQFRRALTLNRNDAPAARGLGRVFHDQGEFALAARYYRQALAGDPSRADTRALLGLVLAERGECGEAIMQFRRSLELDPNAPATHNALGAALLGQGRLGEAKGCFETALSLKPDFADALHNLGNVSLHGGDHAQATLSFQSAMKLAPQRLESGVGLARAWLAQGRTDDAIKACQGVLAQDLDYHPAWVALGKALAVCHCQPGDGDHPPTYDLLLACLRRAGIDHQVLARPAALAIRARYDLSAWPTALSAKDQPDGIADPTLDPLLLALLQRCINVDPILEVFLTNARKLLFLSEFPLSLSQTQFLAALALQGHSNGYAFYVSAEEEARFQALSSRLKRDLSTGTPVAAVVEDLLRFALYAPLSALAPWLPAEGDFVGEIDAALRPLMERSFCQELRQIRVAEDLEQLRPVAEATSVSVQAQYEAAPYPRWLSLDRPQPMTLGLYLRQRLPRLHLPPHPGGPIEALVAGCGTGQHPLTLALACQDLQVIGVDISRRSLAYAVDMADRLAVENVRFLQADILDLAELGRRFSLIECVGVLHHMADPAAGLSVLTDLLRPGGVMKLGLYSGRARASIRAAQERYKALALSSEDRDLRHFRHAVLEGDGAWPGLADLGSTEFYYLSGCRDFVCHACEHVFDLASIAEMLAERRLRFEGFEFADPKIKPRYLKAFPDDPAMTNLENWSRFETRDPSTFLGMYQFWCRRPAASEAAAQRKSSPTKGPRPLNPRRPELR